MHSRRGVVLLAALVALAGCGGGGGDDSTATTSKTTPIGTIEGVPDACTMLTPDRAEKILSPGNEEVFHVEEQSDSTHCLYNSLVKIDSSENGGNLDLQFLKGAPFPSRPDDAVDLDLGDKSFGTVTDDRVYTVYVLMADVLMTFFVQPSPNNPAITVDSAREDMNALAEDMIAFIGCPPRCR